MVCPTIQLASAHLMHQKSNQIEVFTLFEFAQKTLPAYITYFLCPDCTRTGKLEQLSAQIFSPGKQIF